MPQFELERVGAAGFSGIVRARTAEEAVRHAASLDENVHIEIQEQDNFTGWCTIVVDGSSAGRVRPHQRMRFRRA